jgi:hypothetical protein
MLVPKSKYGRGWYTLRKLSGGRMELIDGPYPSKTKAREGYSRALNSVPFGKFPYGTEIALLGAAEIKRRWETVTDRRKEFSGDGQELQEGAQTLQE